MMKASTGDLNHLDQKKKFLLLESNEVDDVNKASETVCALKIEASPTHYRSPTTDTPCLPEVECLVTTTVSVTSETIT